MLGAWGWITALPAAGPRASAWNQDFLLENARLTARLGMLEMAEGGCGPAPQRLHPRREPGANRAPGNSLTWSRTEAFFTAVVGQEGC